jgi:hypothetical protein
MTPTNVLILNQLNQSASDLNDFVLKLKALREPLFNALFRHSTENYYLTDPNGFCLYLALHQTWKRHTTNQHRIQCLDITVPEQRLQLTQFIQSISNPQHDESYQLLNKAIDTLVNTTSDSLPRKYWFDLSLLPFLNLGFFSYTSWIPALQQPHMSTIVSSSECSDINQGLSYQQYIQIYSTFKTSLVSLQITVIPSTPFLRNSANQCLKKLWYR